MDPLFLGGLVVTLLGIVLAMIIDGNSFGVLLSGSSAMLVMCGAVGAATMAYRTSELASLPRSAVSAVTSSVPSIPATITQLAQLADTARRSGMLALEERMAALDDRFLHLGVQLLVDGTDEEVIRETLEIEIAATDERHRTAIGYFRSLGSYAPTFGMVGTVIGLINMLGNLDDPSQLGLGMALALLTTLYGVLFANLLFNPMAIRLERLNELELAAMDVTLDGLLAIQRGASPRALVERLESYLPPSERLGATERLAAGEAA